MINNRIKSKYLLDMDLHIKIYQSNLHIKNNLSHNFRRLLNFNKKYNLISFYCKIHIFNYLNLTNYHPDIIQHIQKCLESFHREMNQNYIHHNLSKSCKKNNLIKFRCNFCNNYLNLTKFL